MALPKRWGPLLALYLVALTVFRCWYAAHHELLQDEAYYWQWARHLDWGYYDNTPLLAVCIRLWVTLFGPNELGVRSEAIVSALIASVFVYLLAKRLLGETVALVSVVLLNTIPIFVAGAVIATQDPAQLALWAAAIYVVQRAFTDETHNGRWWLLGGILAGLTAQAKLNGLLLLPGVLLYLLLSPTARTRWLKRPEPYLAGVLALLIFAPFVWWNTTHQNAFWLHIHAMGSRSSGHDGLKWLGRFLGDQLGLVSPLLFLTYLYCLYAVGRRAAKHADEARLFLWCPTVIVFTATVLISLRSKVEGNWAVAAYITGLILVADALVRAWAKGRGGRVWAGVGVGLAALLASVALFPGLVYSLGFKYPDPSKDRTNELYGWRAMANRIQAEQTAMGGDPFVFGINYRMPSEAAFYLPGKPQTYSLFLKDRANEYRFWENPAQLEGRNAVFVNDTDSPDHLDDVRAVFQHVEVMPPFHAYRAFPYGTNPIRTVQIFRCYGFRGYDVAHWQDGW